MTTSTEGSTDETAQLTKSFIEELSCGICLEISINAMETTCCHQIFCELCVKKCIECPICRSTNLKYSESKVIRRLINNLPTKCEHCCQKFTRFSLKSHLEVCEKRPIQCPKESCKFSGAADSFLQHLIENHRRDVIVNAAALFEKQCVISQNKSESTQSTGNSSSSRNMPNSFLDPIASAVNANGRVARLGISGKYYCGGKLESSCTCCDGNCGPGNGCNCRACMRLDVERRRLPRGYLVNRDGATARRGQENRFYCGRRVLVGVYNCDGFCGPTDGPNCRGCQVLDSMAPIRHADIL